MGLIRLLIYAVLLWLLYRLIKGLLYPGGARIHRSGGSGGGSARQVEGGELVQDPQCGVYIPKETAVRGPGGSYFCSVDCRDAHRRGDAGK